jgi:hypothetical protein
VARMSALTPKADTRPSDWHVRFVPKADMTYSGNLAARCGSLRVAAKPALAGCGASARTWAAADCWKSTEKTTLK